MSSESSIAEAILEEVSDCEATLNDAESIANDSIADLDELDEDIVNYDIDTGDLVITVKDKDTIPECDIPSRLPIVTQEQIWAQEKTIIVKADVSSIKRILEQCDPISSESDNSKSTHLTVENISSESDWSLDDCNNNQKDKRKVVFSHPECEDVHSVSVEDISSSLSLEDVSGGSFNMEPMSLKLDTPDARNSPCPIYGCSFIGRKLKFHVQQMHMPRLMWDNPQPPVREDKIAIRDNLRGELLQFLADCITGWGSVQDLVTWINNKGKHIIPKRSRAITKALVQMQSLAGQMKWPEPSWSSLTPVVSPCQLIHWRFQAVFYDQLDFKNLQTYLCFGADFMSDINNLTKSPFNYALTYSLLARVLAMDDEKPRSHFHLEDSDEETIQPHQEHETIQEPPTKKQRSEIPVPNNDQNQRIYSAYDSHFHLDRSSLKLSGSSTGITIENWLSEQYERPPCVPVNLRGGLLVYCDPETYPATVPFDAKWNVAIGLHPKKVVHATPQDLKKFQSFIINNRVSAIGEIGLDISSNKQNLDKQIEFLTNCTEYMRPQIPVILHIRSTQQDLYSKELYFKALEILKHNCDTKQKIVLHCFTGDKDVVLTWMAQFENTYFGYTNLITSFDQNQFEALRRIPSDRLLAETDSPYMAPQGMRMNSPIYIGEVLQLIATMRYTTISDISRCTTTNALSLFT